MLRLDNLSFRYKLPLRSSILVILTSVLLTTVLVFRESQELQRDLDENARLLGNILAHNLTPPMLQDDIWQAYTQLRAQVSGNGERTPKLLIVFDQKHQIMASSDPSLYPVLTNATDLPMMKKLASPIQQPVNRYTLSLMPAGDDLLAALFPVKNDGVNIGELLLVYSQHGIHARTSRLINSAVVYTLALLAVLLPLTWYWGRRVAQPLINLADSMETIGKQLPADESLQIMESGDEIGRAGTAFRHMLQDLRVKQQMEQAMIASERLAAIGRLTAGLAHEINNPLGGMLNTLDTCRHHSKNTGQVLRTLELLERGLQQIRNTVAAVLVEVRTNNKLFGRTDCEDIRTLLLQEIRKKQVILDWQVEVPTQIPLPATPLRQVIFNLLLNAIQSVPERGQIRVNVALDEQILRLSLCNEGPPIPESLLAQLFEPFSGTRPDGHGLGLWISYQIVRQMNGEIQYQLDDASVCFQVSIPLPEQPAARNPA